jgi:hypothetical protein
MKPGKLRLATIALLLVAAPSSAFAYIDPWTGSMLIQSLLGAIAAALVFGRSLWHRVRSFFVSRRGAKPPQGSDKPH